MQKYKIINNMFGDALWALAYYLENYKNKTLIVANNSILDKISRELGLQNIEKIKIANIAKIDNAIYNIIHSKTIKSVSAIDLCYPTPNQNTLENFYNSLSITGDSRILLQTYLLEDPRFFTFGYPNPLLFHSSKLGKLIQERANNCVYTGKLKGLKPYVVLNLRQPSRKELIGFKGPDRSETKFHDLSLAIELLNQSGYNIIYLQKNLIIRENGKIEKLDIPESGIMRNFEIVNESDFCISSRNGFTVIPAFLGKECIELNATDLVVNINPKSYTIPKKFHGKAIDKMRFKEIIMMPGIYSNNSVNVEHNIFHQKLSKDEILRGVEIFLSHRNEPSSRIYFTGDIVGIEHLFLKTIPHNFIDVTE